MPHAIALKPLAFPKLDLADVVTSRRMFVLLPFGMIAGLIAYAGLPFEPEGWALAAVATTLLIAILGLQTTSLLAVCSLLSSIWLGFCLLPLHGLWFGTTMMARPAFGYYEARVEEIISATDEARRIVVSGITPVTDDRPVLIAKARLVVPPNPPLAPGDFIRGQMRLAPVPGPILPGAFDSQFHAYFAGIGAYGNVTGDFSRVAEGGALDATRAVEGLRMAIGSRIDAVLDGSSAAIGRAMVVGDQSLIDDETREVMAASGLAHIYSISGLHLSIVAGGMFFLLRLGLASLPGVASRWPVKKIAAIGGIIAAMAYLLLAGGLANVPALRSTIMLGLIFGAVIAGRRALTMRNVAIAALAIILIDPASVFRASFQLSFAAVVALIGIYEIPRRAPEGERTWGRRLWDTVWATAATSFIAGTATLLFSAYHFQQTAPLGVLGNVLVLPVVSLVIMPFAVLSVLAMPFGMEAPFIRVMGWGIDRMVDGATLVAGWSEGWTGNPLLTSSALLIGLGALAWFAFVNSWWRLAGPIVALPLILLVGLDQRPDILIADTTQAVAMRTDAGMGLISGKVGSFAVDVWGEHYQEVIAAEVPGMRCDELGCIAQTSQFSVAIVRNAAAFAEDCGRHDLIIARVRAPNTCAGQVIDADDLASGGVHWLRWDETAARFEIRAAIPNLTRPWRVSPR
ncbi:ComEC/Rec2 family competence protein [Devosia sp. YR412]|uniref:ComEC/Rec2 family competence protein n=1 Tax=Devosia sp. YR412 TaxID=1881030 RepID=UPI0011136270|nr:ComEC/Rec2 family competence protein [Devosia sp. YR412]